MLPNLLELAPNPWAIVALALLAASCTPSGRAISTLDPNRFVDGGFDEAGNPVDGGVVSEDDAGLIGPPDSTVVNVVYDQCPDTPHQLSVPVLVNDGANASIARDPNLTQFVVPFARDTELYSLNSLVVMDAVGARLPAQFEVLSRYNGHPSDCSKPIRYAFAHVRSVPAPGASVEWRVASDADNSGESTPMVVSESTGSWVIDTSVARFTVRRDRFDGLSRVELPNDSGGFDVVSEGGGFFIDHGGEKSTSGMMPWHFRLERAGPQLVTVAARGYYSAGGGARDLAYTIRMHFSAGSSVVRVDHAYYFGEVEGWGAEGLTNTTRVARAFMRVPFAGADSVRARALTEVATLSSSTDASLEQQKRTPQRIPTRYAIRQGGQDVQSGARADRPFLAVSGGGRYVLATLARMAVREPQGLSWNAGAGALEVGFTSSEIQIGGARGIWGVAALDFGRGAPDGARADVVQLAAERPLLGAPRPSYVNGTRTIGPYALDDRGPAAAVFAVLGDIHQRTATYFDEFAITGIQLWPDLPRSSCYEEFNCDSARNRLHEGGDNNYWNWSKPGIDEFFRTGDNRLIYDFSLGEAITYVETLAVRTYRDRVSDSSVAGLAPCYGDSRGYGGDYREGLNNRRDRCVADYSYDKTLKLAFLATGDARFVDFFEEAGESVVNAFGAPPPVPEQFLELTLNRLSEQRFEVLTDGAEFARDPTSSELLRTRLRTYVDYMLGRVLIDGHSCDVGGRGTNDTRTLGRCVTSQAWMMPMGVEWAMRASRFMGHSALAQWVIRHGAQTGAHHAVLGGNGLPDFSRSGDSWRTVYSCNTTASGVNEGSCQQLTDGENGLRFYANGLMAYLNVFGLVLAADPSDPNRICQWLPAAYRQQVTSMNDLDVNAFIWGKSSGQAFAMSAETAGALSMCP